MNELVSIIVPCYNSEDYIAETIRSVIDQTYTNWELLITDDCSTDKSTEIIKEYTNCDERIKLFSTTLNTGHPSVPRNISISKANGDYIAFLDSDDRWLPKKLEEQLIFIKKEGCDIITSYAQLMTEDGKLINRIVKIKAFACYKDFLKNYEMTSPTILCTSKVVSELVFPSVYKEDYVAWLSVLKKGFLVKNTQKVHALYRVRNNSRSRNKFAMLSYQWKILRKQEKLSFIYSLYCVSSFVYKTVQKNYF